MTGATLPIQEVTLEQISKSLGIIPKKSSEDGKLILEVPDEDYSSLYQLVKSAQLLYLRVNRVVPINHHGQIGDYELIVFFEEASYPYLEVLEGPRIGLVRKGSYKLKGYPPFMVLTKRVRTLPEMAQVINVLRPYARTHNLSIHYLKYYT